MNIDSLCSSPINILLGVINGSCSFGLLVWLATNCPLKLVANCSKIWVKHLYHYGIQLVFLHIIFRCVLIAILTISNLHLQWKIDVSTMPLSHYIQSLRTFVSIL